MKMVKKLARQGDLLFVRIDNFPEKLKKAQDKVLALGEVTGHSHKCAEDSPCAVMENEAGGKFVEVFENTTVTHDEHGPVTLTPGKWEVRRQREYSPEEIRQVKD